MSLIYSKNNYKFYLIIFILMNVGEDELYNLNELPEGSFQIKSVKLNFIQFGFKEVEIQK